MTDDIVTMLRREYDYFNNDGVGDYELLTIAADEIERLRALMKTFVSAWGRSELGENNGSEYFNAVHAMRQAVRGD